MSGARIDGKTLRRRPTVVSRLLRPLTDGRAVAARLSNDSRWVDAALVVAHHANFDDYNQSRFRCRGNLVANYYEVWSTKDVGKSWRLARAYLTLFEVERLAHTEREICAVHCDPEEMGRHVSERCKRGPHMHVSFARVEIKKSHIPLNYGHLDAVLGSADSITRALCDACEIIAAEVLVHFAA